MNDSDFVHWERTSKEAWNFITRNFLNDIARDHGVTVGVRESRNGFGYEIFYAVPERKDQQ